MICVAGQVVCVAGVLVVAGCTGSVDRATPTRVIEHMRVEVVDTLPSHDNQVIGEPLWIGEDRLARFVIVDGSDRNIRVIGKRGANALAAGGIGPEAGRFMTLRGGGALGDELFGYDFTNSSLSFFDGHGRHARTVKIASAGDAQPRTVRPVDDSLLLVVNFGIGAPTADLIRLIRPNGSVRSSFFSGKSFYTPVIPDLVQRTAVVADAADGVVYAGFFGGDSVYAFDYDGRRLAAGPLEAPHGVAIPRHREAIEANGGRILRNDGVRVTNGMTTLLALIAIDRTHVVVQLVKADFRNRTGLDVTAGGEFVLLNRDESTGALTATARENLQVGLLGRDARGLPLALRFVGSEYDVVEVSRLRVVEGQP